jgi:hypothetical protein
VKYRDLSAPDGKAVQCFGRDAVCWKDGEERATTTAKTKADSYGMTNKRTNKRTNNSNGKSRSKNMRKAKW